VKVRQVIYLAPEAAVKVKDVLPLSHGSPGIGYRYRLCYVMSGKATECDAEIVEFDAPRRLATRMRELTQSDSKAGDRTFVEEFTIIDHADYVLLQQKVTVSGFRIPVVFRFLFWLLTAGSSLLAVYFTYPSNDEDS